jgi:hypothetical protein
VKQEINIEKTEAKNKTKLKSANFQFLLLKEKGRDEVTTTNKKYSNNNNRTPQTKKSRIIIKSGNNN